MSQQPLLDSILQRIFLLQDEILKESPQRAPVLNTFLDQTMKLFGDISSTNPAETLPILRRHQELHHPAEKKPRIESDTDSSSAMETDSTDSSSSDEEGEVPIPAAPLPLIIRDTCSSFRSLSCVYPPGHPRKYSAIQNKPDDVDISVGNIIAFKPLDSPFQVIEALVLEKSSNDEPIYKLSTIYPPPPPEAAPEAFRKVWRDVYEMSEDQMIDIKIIDVCDISNVSFS
ncbi:hypothetical protein GEMRC1_008466 [Eukaryota sp. GEM-RC1]